MPVPKSTVQNTGGSHQNRAQFVILELDPEPILSIEKGYSEDIVSLSFIFVRTHAEDPEHNERRVSTTQEADQ